MSDTRALTNLALQAVRAAEAAAVAAQERGDDADDQGRFEAFTQTDDQGGEHAGRTRFRDEVMNSL